MEYNGVQRLAMGRKLLKYGAGDRVRTGDVQLGKTTFNWKQRTLPFQHLVLAIENSLFFTLCVRAALNGAQTEHTNSRGLKT